MTKIDIEQLKVLHAKGVSVKEISKHFKCTEHAVYLRMRELNLKPNKPNRSISLDAVLQLHSKGMDDFQIAEHLNCTPGTIIRKRRLLGLPNITHNYQSAHLQKEFSDLILSYYDKGYSDIKIVKRMHKDGIDVSLSIIKHWRKINKLAEANKRIIEPHEVKGEESLFCNTEFLENYFKKPLSKKECV